MMENTLLVIVYLPTQYDAVQNQHGEMNLPLALSNLPCTHSNMSMSVSVLFWFYFSSIDEENMDVTEQCSLARAIFILLDIDKHRVARGSGLLSSRAELSAAGIGDRTSY